MTSIWFMAWICIIDLGLNWVGRFEEARTGGQSSLARYLEYGRSLEGKLERMVGKDGQGQNSIISAGWIDPAQWTSLPADKARADQTLMVVYGQSFAFRVARQALASNDRLVLRSIGGPAAPISHSYAAYLADTHRSRADIVVVGVLASSLDKSSAISGAGYTFENPAPFTFPRHFQSPQGVWQAELPVVQTEQGFRQAFQSRGETWSRFVDQLMRNNPALDAFVVKQSVLDESALARLARRGWYSAKNAESKEGTDNDQHQGALARNWAPNLHALSQMQALAASRQERLIVLLFQDKGTPKEVSDTLIPFFKNSRISYIDSREFIDPMDKNNFIADGHFVAAADEKIAQRLLGMIKDAP